MVLMKNREQGVQAPRWKESNFIAYSTMLAGKKVVSVFYKFSLVGLAPPLGLGFMTVDILPRAL